MISLNVRTLACARFITLITGRTFATTRAWIGSASDNRWSVAGNWSPNGVPQTGDELLFNDYGSLTKTVMTNDLPASVAIQRMVLYQVHNGNGPGWTLNGSTLRMAGSLESEGDVNFNVPVHFVGAGRLSGGTFAAGVSLAQGLVMRLYGASMTQLSGSGTFDCDSILYLSGQNTFSGTMKIGFLGSGGPGILFLNGASLVDASMIVYGRGRISGNGSVGPAEFHGGSLLPGSAAIVNYEHVVHTPGQIDTGSLTFFAQETSHGLNSLVSAVYTVAIAGTQAGSGYSRVNVNGTISLGTTTSPQLEIEIASGYTPPPGQQFMIMNNDGTDAVDGNFRCSGAGGPGNSCTSLTESAVFSRSGVPFRITYKGGDGNDVVLTTIGTSSTALASSTSSSVSGESVTFTATVTGTGGMPTGTVSFHDGATLLGTAPVNASGQAVFSASLDAGTHNITATFGGDSAHAGSTSASMTQNAGKASTVISALVESSGQPFVLRVTVAITAPGSGTASGTVTVSEANSLLTTSALAGNGSATLMLPTLSAGTHLFKIDYSGDARFLPSSTTLAQDAGSPSVMAREAASSEGNVATTWTIPIDLFPSSPMPVAVGWSTEDGTATAGTDYAAASGTVIFPPGQTTSSIELRIVGDRFLEEDEAFYLVLHSADAGVVTPRIRITILNDDVVPQRRRPARH